MPLQNPKHQRFVAEYLKDRSATQAAIRAGYSPKTAKQQGSRLLTHADIRAAIDAGEATHLAKADVTAQRVLDELAKLAFVDPRKFFNPDGTLKNPGDLDDDTAAAIAEFVILKENITSGDGKSDLALRVKWVDKLRALELLAKRFGLLKEQIEITGAAEFIGRLARARQRVKKR
jgi:phage terminase small subunit